MPTLTENAVTKYIKIKALAERGASGERDNAGRILHRMESEYPGIRAAAESRLRSQETRGSSENGGSSDSTQSSTGYPQGGPFPGGPFPGNWENLFRYAKTAYTYASDFAETVADSQVGYTLSEYADVSARLSRKGNVLVTLRMPLDIFQEAQQLNTLQKQAFRNALHGLLDEQLDELLGEE